MRLISALAVGCLLLLGSCDRLDIRPLEPWEIPERKS